MSKGKRLRCEKARRAMFDLQELVANVLEENPEGLEPNQIATELNIIVPKGQPRYPGGTRSDIAWGILHGLVGEGRVEKRGSRAFLSDKSLTD